MELKKPIVEGLHYHFIGAGEGVIWFWFTDTDATKLLKSFSKTVAHLTGVDEDEVFLEAGDYVKTRMETKYVQPYALSVDAGIYNVLFMECLGPCPPRLTAN